MGWEAGRASSSMGFVSGQVVLAALMFPLEFQGHLVLGVKGDCKWEVWTLDFHVDSQKGNLRSLQDPSSFPWWARSWCFAEALSVKPPSQCLSIFWVGYVEMQLGASLQNWRSYPLALKVLLWQVLGELCPWRAAPSFPWRNGRTHFWKLSEDTVQGAIL